MELKKYQKRVIADLVDYLKHVNTSGSLSDLTPEGLVTQGVEDVLGL